ncbi:transferase family protein [Aspergillus ustus]|uniref:O-acetyltransferase pboB n=1 Tax=Aspergillus ustus TaxID=40382 RepID=PBOB_ASPUT|nr:RecName: Full=O-acetyltransferase pboB; AltName: Full=Protubonine biosynthesis cluster protein B [Aspergillus ustus]KIA75847.1 transferase family protein [Aspergillus ustus]
MVRTDDQPYVPTPIDRLFSHSYVRTQLAFQLDDVSGCATLLRRGMERLIRTSPFLSRELTIHMNDDQTESITTKPISPQELDRMLKIKHHEKPLRQALIEASNDRDCLDDKFMPTSFHRLDVSQPCPVMVVQANIHPDGVLLAVATNHMVMDATGQGIAVQCLADCCRLEQGDVVSLPTCSADQDRGRELLLHELPARIVNREFSEYRPCRDLYSQSAALADLAHKAATTIRVAHFTIAAEHVHALKTRCNEMLSQVFESNGHVFGADDAPWISSSDVVIALIWRSINCARYQALTTTQQPPEKQAKKDSGEVVHVGIPVNVRSRVSPVLPGSYMGNGAILVLVPQPLRTFSGTDWMSTICRVGLAVRTRLAAITSDEIRSLLHYILNAPDPIAFSFDVADYFVSNWRQMGFYEADFGSKMGKPQRIRNPDGVVGGTVFIMPKRSQPENAPWELQVSLTDEMLRLLDQDDVWATYVRPDTYWP